MIYVSQDWITSDKPNQTIFQLCGYSSQDVYKFIYDKEREVKNYERFNIFEGVEL